MNYKLIDSKKNRLDYGLISKLKLVGNKLAKKIRILYFIKQVEKKEILSQFKLDESVLEILLLKHSLIEDIIHNMYYREAVRMSLKAKNDRFEEINKLMSGYRGK